GVAGNVKHFGLDETPLPTLYAPLSQIPAASAGFAANNLSLAVRTDAEPLALADTVRRAVQRIDGDIPVSGARSMEQALESTVAPRRFSSLLLGLFSASALAVAA